MHDPKLSENEVQRFEREVQQKMEELEFSPSAAVWENVARAVSTEKKRRVPFFWLFFLPALLLAGGAGLYWVTGQANKGRHKPNGQAVASQTTPVSSTTNPSPQAHGSQQAGASPQANLSSPASSPQQAAPAQPGNNSVANAQPAPDRGHTGKDLVREDPLPDNQPARTAPSASGSSIPSTIPRSHTRARGTDAALRPGRADRNNRTTVITEGGDDPSLVAKDPTSDSQPPPATGAQAPSQATNQALDKPAIRASSAASHATNQGLDKPAIRTSSDASNQAPSQATNLLWAASHLHPVNLKTRDAIQAATLAKSPAIARTRLSPKRPWEAGFTAGAGISSINQTLFKGASVTASDSRNLAAPTPVTGSVNQTYVSKIKPDLSFWAGIVLQKPFGNNFAVSVGLNLHYYSTKVSTGDKVVNNASGYYYSPASSLLIAAAAPASAQSYPYYAAGDKQSFINRYYFLEIPGSIQWQISHMHNLPLFWEVGGSLSYLMSANAIYYNTKAGVYYKDGQVSNKAQFNLSTALMMSVPLKGVQMQVGPQVQYGVTSLLNTGGSGGQHFLYGGVKLVLFPGKLHKTSRRFSQEQ